MFLEIELHRRCNPTALILIKLMKSFHKLKIIDSDAFGEITDESALIAKFMLFLMTLSRGMGITPKKILSTTPQCLSLRFPSPTAWNTPRICERIGFFVMMPWSILSISKKLSHSAIDK